jgi:hypothetical protein
LKDSLKGIFSPKKTWRALLGIGKYFLCIMGVLLISLSNHAEDSNREDGRTNLESDGWYVVWGHNYTEGDWVEAGMAAFSSIVAENPAIFIVI